MGRYIVLYLASVGAMEQMANATPEQMQESMTPWLEWAAQCGDGLVDLGAPLGRGQRLSVSGSAASDSGVVGYSVLEAASMDAAKALLEGHPHLEWTAGCQIDVHEILPRPM